jgi:hypothetical protein
MQFNRPAIEGRMDLLGRVLGLTDTSYGAVLEWVMQFRGDLGIPDTLGHMEVPDDQADAVGKLAEADPSTGGNPRPMNADDMKAVFLNAVHGRL